MLRMLIVLTLAVLSVTAQTHKGMTEEQIENADKQVDVTLLRNLPKIRIGQVMIMGTAGIARNISETEGRKLLFDSLNRYNIPVESTPPSSSGYPTEVPTLFFSNSCSKGGCTNGCVVIQTVFQLELYETVTLNRAKPVKISVPVWTAKEEADFDPETNRDETFSVLQRLVEKFSLSYLAANR